MSRQDEKKLYEQQENRILAQSDAFISLLTKRGILGDQKIDDEKVRAGHWEQTDGEPPGSCGKVETAAGSV